MLAAIAIGSVLVGSFAPAWHSAPPTTQELAESLVLAGLDPEALAAAGLTPAEIPDLVSRFDLALAEHIDSLRSADDNFAFWHAEAGRLRRIAAVRRDPAAVQAFNAASDLAAKAGAARRDAIDACRFDAIAPLPSPSTEALAAIRLARAREPGVPAYLLIDAPDAPSSVALRDAWMQTRLPAQVGTSAAAGAAQYLANHVASPKVAASMAAHTQHAAAVNLTWTAAVSK